MAHNLEMVNGKASFVSMNQSAWHNLGNVVSDLATWQEIAGEFMNWEIDKIEIVNALTGAGTGFYGLYRDDTLEMLHVAKGGYEVTQNAALFEFLTALQGEGAVQFETAGVLGKGEKVFVTAKTGEFDLMASGDIHKTYILGTTSHDGSLSETYKLTETRVVCNNTLSAALSENGKDLKFKHTKNAANRRADALNILRASQATAQTLQEKFEILAQRQVNSEIIGQTLAQLFKIDLAKDLSKGEAEKIMTIQSLFESNDNNAFPEFKNTGYNLLNAITEYADHHKTARSGDGSTTAEKQRAYSAVFGSGDKLKNEALELVIELTNGATLTNQPKIYSYSQTSDLVADLLSANN